MIRELHDTIGAKWDELHIAAHRRMLGCQGARASMLTGRCVEAKCRGQHRVQPKGECFGGGSGERDLTGFNAEVLRKA
jgi:hypothetical protein